MEIEPPTMAMEPPMVERAIIQSAQEGDINALGILYDTRVNKVYRYTLARIGSVHDAEDITQEVFFKMYKGLPAYQFRESPFDAWLMRIARNEVIAFTRKPAYKHAQRTEELTETMEDYHIRTPEQIAEVNDDLRRIRRAVEILPESQREVVLLRFAAGLNVKETADTLGKTQNNVKVLQTKGLGRMREILAPGMKL